MSKYRNGEAEEAKYQAENMKKNGAAEHRRNGGISAAWHRALSGQNMTMAAASILS
jgi:hypothetical protein